VKAFILKIYEIFDVDKKHIKRNNRSRSYMNAFLKHISIKSMFTKLLLAVMCLAIVTSCNSGSNGQTSEDNSNDKMLKSTVNCKYELFDSAIDEEGNIFIADKEQIHIFSNSIKEINIIRDNLSFCTALCAANGRIYAFDRQNSEIKVFDYKGTLMKTYRPEGIGIITKMQYTDENRLLVLDSSSEKTGRLSYYYLDGNRLEPFSFDNVTDFSMYEKNKIILSIRDNNLFKDSICIYDLNKKDIISKNDIGTAIDGFTYNSPDSKVYYASSGNIYAYDLRNQSQRTVFLSDNTNFRKLISDEKYCYIFDKKDFKINKVYKEGISFDYNDGKDIQMISDVSTQLNIFTCFSQQLMNSISNKIMNEFARKYPNVRVNFEIDTTSEYSIKLQTKLSANDSDIDIFMIYFNIFDLSYMKSEALLDLNQYEQITRCTSEMFDGVIRNCTYNGKLVGVPYRYAIQAWEVNEELLQKLGLGYPEKDWTWEDFYEYAKKARQDIDGDGIFDTYALSDNKEIFNMPIELYDNIFFNQLENKALFDTEEYVNLLKLTKKINDEKLIYNEYKAEKKISKQNILFKPQIINMWMGDSSFILPPVLKSSKAYRTYDFALFCINRNSKNADVAAEYLASYLSKDIILTESMVLSYEDIDYYKNAKSDNIIILDRKVSSEKNYNLIKELVEYSKVNYLPWEIRKFKGEVIYNKFFNGEMTAEEAASLMNEKAKMIIGE